MSLWCNISQSLFLQILQDFDRFVCFVVLNTQKAARLAWAAFSIYLALICYFTYTSDMKIRKIQFVKGITEGDYSWDENRPQVVLYGRSNAGKSSTINALLNNKTVAKTSAAAGKTKQINFFNINDSFYLLDLPGYGYARGSKGDRQQLDDLIVWFIADTQASKRVHIVVVDAQVGITDLDADMLEYLYRTNDPIILLLNKTDKMNQSEISKMLNDTHSKIAGVVQSVIFSAKEKKGTDKVWKLIEQSI